MMKSGQRFGYGVGLAIATSMALILPGVAQPANQSDITGTNVFNSPTDFYEQLGDRLDPATLDEARRLSQDLDDAYAACQASVQEAANQPRRFAIGTPTNTSCVSPECQRYSQLVEQIRNFLLEIGLDAETVDQTVPQRVW
jgi:hypothetical protein